MLLVSFLRILFQTYLSGPSGFFVISVFAVALGAVNFTVVFSFAKVGSYVLGSLKLDISVL